MSTTAPRAKRRLSLSGRRGRQSAKLFAAVLGLFLAGYLIAVYVMFPPPAAPEDGIPVPDIKGMSVGSARDRLQPLGLNIGDTLSVPHSTVAPGLIVAQSPLAGQQLRAGGHVHVGLSSGLPSATVPELIGLGARRAANLLERLGFEVDQTLEASDRPNGTVIRSVPETGVRKPLPARVLLVVSTGLSALDTIRPDTVQRDTLR